MSAIWPQVMAAGRVSPTCSKAGSVTFAVDAQGLVVVAAPGGDVGDLAPGDGD
jgi:hypothetical protein